MIQRILEIGLGIGILALAAYMHNSELKPLPLDIEENCAYQAFARASIQVPPTKDGYDRHSKLIGFYNKEIEKCQKLTP